MSDSPPTLPTDQSQAPALPTTPALPSAPNAALLTQDDRTMGMLSHLVAILGGIIGAVIMFACMNQRSVFIQHHTKEALNFQITLLIISIGGMIVTAILGLVTMGFALFILIPLMIAVGILFLVFEIMACIAANKGQWHRYPWSIRFIK